MIEINTTPDLGMEEAMNMLIVYMARNKCWATPEETEEWLKTETGKQIKALIDIERQKDKRRQPA